MKIVGLPRYSLSNISAGSSVPATMPLTNLTNGEPWDTARLTEVDPLKTYVEGVPAMPNGYYGPEPSVGGVAWVNHSLSLGATARTLLLSTAVGADSYTPEGLLPNADYDHVGAWSGTFADVDDDPFAPDANAQTSSGDGSGFAAVSYDFATPTKGDPETGEDAQLFALRVSWTGSPDPTVAFSLLNAGAIVTSIIYNIPGGPPLQSGETVLLPWAMDSSMSPDGFGVGLRVTFSGIAAASTVSVHAVRWVAHPALDPGEVIGDSGWTAVSMDQYDAAWGATVSGSVAPGPQQTFLHSFGGENVSGVAKIVTMFRDPLNSDGFLDLGEFVAGPIFSPGENVDWGEVVTLRGHDRAIKSEGGGSWGISREPTRSLRINLSSLTPTEAQSLLERLWRAGGLMPWVAQIFDDVTESRHTTLYVCAESLPRLSANYVDYRAVSFDAVEKL